MFLYQNSPDFVNDKEEIESMITIMRTYIIGCCLLMINSAVISQDFFKQLEESDKYFNQQVTRFPNGDLLIGDSSLEAQRTGTGGQIYMTRIDPCGNVEWSRTYERQEEYMEFKDFQISDNNEIFIFGSAYSELDEMLFFLKLNSRGNVLNFQLYDPGTVDHFSYSIDLKNNLILTYGLLLDFGTQKHGFISIFDENLNFKWSKKFTPFDSNGDAYFTADGGFICRSGPYLFKLKPSGNLDWAFTMSSTVPANPVAGPFEVAGGYLLQAHSEGFSFFYKIDLEGQLTWKSDKFRSNSFPAALTPLDNGSSFVTYIYPDPGKNRLSYFTLSPDGEISGQHHLNIDLSLQTGTNYHALSDDNILSIAGNPDPFSSNSADVSSFLMQSALYENESECFNWEAFTALESNAVPLFFTPLDTAILDHSMTRINTGKIVEFSSPSPLTDGCDLEGQHFVTIDTLLDCGEDWTVTLPSEEFIWEDDHPDHTRTFRVVGTYSAKNQDCGNLITYEYTLNKPTCECPVYLPTAFSPNEDGRNDQLELFSGCMIAEMQMTVFSRWGEKVFESRTPGRYWDGRYRGKRLPNGLYLVKIDYRWMDTDGNLQTGAIRQAVTLVK